jgi:galactitol-specific phosphotransferase system IIB component
MAYQLTDQLIGAQPINENSTTQKHPLGTIVRAVDPTFGEGEFIYLVGVASTTIGLIVNYDVATTQKYQTALSTTAVAKTNPLAVAMSANVAGEFGWYQISGLAVCSKALATSLVVGSTLMAIAGEAEVSDTSNLIHGAITALVASANTSDAVVTVQVMLNRPANAAVA